MITNNQLVDAINHALLPCSLWCVMGGTRANYTRAVSQGEMDGKVVEYVDVDGRR